MSDENDRKDTKENDAVSPPKATQVDPGWRKKDPADARQATQVDAGWRGKDTSGRNATEVDAGWRKQAADAPESENAGAAPARFASIDAFKDAAEKLTELRSASGRVYSVKKTISRAGGESVVLLCADPDGNDVAVKVYYEPVDLSTRSAVLDYMKTEEGKKYTLAVIETGFVALENCNCYFEIMPYCASTDLSDDGAYSFAQIVEIAAQLNEALHSMHQAGIIHRDIKPENLYEIGGQYKFGDFGIAKNGVRGRSNVTKHILGTEGYRAPETTRYIFSSASDYYSLGVTLASLYEGRFVFEKMTFEMQALALESERLPLTKTDPDRESLENLLNGLCRIDPKRRFGYEDVKFWLADHSYTGGGLEEEWQKEFRLLNDVYRDEKSMFYGITQDEEHWESAKRMLYTKIIEQFFASFRTDLAVFAQDVEKEYRNENDDKGLAIFLKKLYAPGAIVWKGMIFQSLGELGSAMLSAGNMPLYVELLQNRCISHWLANTEGIEVDKKTVKLVDLIEDLSQKEPEVAVFWFGNAFAPKRKLKICNKTVTTVNGLMKALFASPNDFYQTDGDRKLLSRSDGADLYGFLYSFGYKDIVEKTWKDLASYDLFNRTVILLSMLDTIAVEAGADPTGIREFFTLFGPVGLATFTKKLAEHSVYIPLDANGKEILDKIARFDPPAGGTVDELFRAYIPLIELAERLRGNLVENPHCILGGIYDNSGAICTNLSGCFAFEIFDRLAPLGFNAWIETNGGKQE